MTDWFRLLADLHKSGINNSEVARRLNVDRWKVQDWKEGCEPGYHYGYQLISLHAKHCPNVAPKLPLQTDAAL